MDYGVRCNFVIFIEPLQYDKYTQSDFNKSRNRKDYQKQNGITAGLNIKLFALYENKIKPDDNYCYKEICEYKF